MASIFDLKTSVEELSSTNEGTSRMEYDQHPPTRDVVNDNFANGAIHFRFQTSGQKWWIPSRSYIRTRFKLTQGDGTTPLARADEIAPNMALMSNLFQSAEMRINDKVVSRVSDFLPQVDALEQRLTKSKSWLDSVGESTNWWEDSQLIRLQEVSSDGALVKDIIPASNPEQIQTQTQLGYDNAHTVAYVANTGVITFAQGGAGGAPPDATVVYEEGDLFAFTAAGNAGVSGVRMRVVQRVDPLNIRVEPIATNDLAAAVVTTNTFSRIRPGADAINEASRRISEFELCWCPPLSLFKVGHALPSGRYELVLNPQTSTAYQKRAIESTLGVGSKNPTLPGGGAQNFKLNVVNMYLYCATVEGPRADDITYLLDLEQTRCQAEKIDNPNLQQKNFDVSPSTYALTCAYQDLRAGEHTSISASKFKSYDNALNPTASQELKLNRFYIQYAGQSLPAPDADPSFIPSRDYTIQRYNETQIYSGAYFDTGGAETIEEYHERGSYYYFSWPRDGTDRSTRVIVNQAFIASGGNAADVDNMRLLLFDHSKQIARIRVQDGRVVDVQLEDA